MHSYFSFQEYMEKNVTQALSTLTARFMLSRHSPAKRKGISNLGGEAKGHRPWCAKRAGLAKHEHH